MCDVRIQWLRKKNRKEFFFFFPDGASLFPWCDDGNSRTRSWWGCMRWEVHGAASTELQPRDGVTPRAGERGLSPTRILSMSGCELSLSPFLGTFRVDVFRTRPCSISLYWSPRKMTADLVAEGNRKVYSLTGVRDTKSAMTVPRSLRGL